MHLLTQARRHTHVRIHQHARAYIQTHTHTYTQTHTHTPTPAPTTTNTQTNRHFAHAHLPVALPPFPPLLVVLSLYAISSTLNPCSLCLALAPRLSLPPPLSH